MKGGYLFKDFWGDAVSRLYHFMKKIISSKRKL